MTSLRILVVGGRPASKVARQLVERGHACVTASSAQAVPAAQTHLPDAVILTGPWKRAPEAIAQLRQLPQLRAVPMVADTSDGAPPGRLDVDSVAATSELEAVLLTALRARESMRREEQARLRLEVQVELARFASSCRDSEQLLRRTALRLKEVLPCEQVSVLTFDAGPPVQSRLLDPVTSSQTAVDLALSPAMRTAVATRSPSVAEGTLVQPLADGETVNGALLLRRTFGPWPADDLQFVAAVAATIGPAVETNRLFASLQRERGELEAAYLERYRELGEANRRLKAVDKVKDELLAMVSHDVRAPLQVLLGHGRLLLDSKELKDTHRPSVETTVRMGKKILGLVESLLDKARTDAEPLALERRVFDLAEVCTQTVDELQILAREQSVALQVEAPMSVDILGDELKIRQVLQNLVTNALAHAKGATKVWVRCTPVRLPDGALARVVVEDDGAGVPEEQLPRLFDRYAQSGLGLTICRDFVTLHGGEIWAERGEQRGTTFIFTLPMQRSSLEPGRSESTAPLVLIAQHDPALAQLCELSLRGTYRLELARDGDEAIEKARRLLPDLVLVDLFLPRRDGLETIKALAADPKTARLPAVLLSGNKDLGERLRALDLGAVEVLARPFEPAELLKRVKGTLARNRPALAATPPPGNDPATGLFDQLGLVTRLEQEMSRADRYERPLTLAVLKPAVPPKEQTSACAAIVRNELRAPDVLGHLGNGVLVVVLPETALEPARGLSARLCLLLETQGVSYSVRLLELRGDQPAAAALESLLA